LRTRGDVESDVTFRRGFAVHIDTNTRGKTYSVGLGTIMIGSSAAEADKLLLLTILNNSCRSAA
jgi:hypothetical protein